MRSMLMAAAGCVVAHGAAAQTPLLTQPVASPAPAAPLGAPVPPPPSLRFGAAPKWVKPAAIPPAPINDGGGGEVQVLLSDSQSFLGPDGDETYNHSAVKILNESGLAALGTLQQSWNPETDLLTLHALKIVREGHVIDVLRDGAAVTVLRREANLEKAALDGRLTATLQIEDLRVGDILEKEGTLRHRDPAMGGFSQYDDGVTPRLAIVHARIRVLWPDDKDLHWRVTPGLPTPVIKRDDGVSELLIDLHDVHGPVPPNGAPGRYRYRARLEVTQFASWRQAAAVMAPLYLTAARLPASSPLRLEVAAIEHAASSPEERTSLALALVQRKVRYQFVGLNDGGYVPASADETWARRYGDCKGKTVLLLALLHELGVEAEPVLVSSAQGDGMNERLPELAYFDHVLVRARLGETFVWLDGTKPTDPRDVRQIPPPPFLWGLPLFAPNADLMKIAPKPLETPLDEETTVIDASAGLDAAATQRSVAVTHGDLATSLGVSINRLPHNQAEKALRDAFANTTSSFDLKSIDWTYDADHATFTLRAQGIAHLDWRWNRDIGAREHLLSNVSATPPPGPPRREPGPDQDAPYAVPYPVWSAKHLTILLPNGGKGFSVVGDNLDRTAGAVTHMRHVRLSGATLTLDSSTRSTAAEYPVSEALAVTRLRRDLNDDPVAIRAPKGQRAPLESATAG